LKVELEVARQKIKQLQDSVGSQPQTQGEETFQANELKSIETALNKHLPERELKEVKRILFGNEAQTLTLPPKAHEIASKNNFILKGYKIHAAEEQIRQPRIVRIGAV